MSEMITRIKAYREMLSMSQKQLAEKVEDVFVFIEDEPILEEGIKK